ncbi:MAG: MFS transporter, partial [Acidobacteriota bacterium]|nr:MFS transporter [Acidobacteriota bacterium]
LPMALSIITGAQVSSRLVPRIGVRPLLTLGATMATLGFLWLALIEPHSAYWPAIVVPSVICALAMGLLFMPLASAATAGVSKHEAGLASGVLNTSRQVGGSVALAVLGTVAADRTATFVDRHSALALVSGYQRAFQTSAAITAAALVVSLFVPRVAPSRPRDERAGRRRRTASAAERG